MSIMKKSFLAALMGVALAAPVAQAELTIGLIPAEDTSEMIKKFEPMRVHLEKKLGEPVKVFTATDYAGVIEAMRKKRIDMAWFGPLTTVLAEKEAGAEPFAVGIRKGSDGHTYQGYMMVRCDSGIKSMSDLKGKNAAFVNPASTSGGLVPSFMIAKEFGEKPEQFLAS